MCTTTPGLIVGVLDLIILIQFPEEISRDLLTEPSSSKRFRVLEFTVFSGSLEISVVT